MNEIPDEWSELDTETQLNVKIEREMYDVMMHPDFNDVRVFFPDNGEDIAHVSTAQHVAPFNFQVAFHKEVLDKPTQEYVDEIAEELSEEFDGRISEVYDSFDGLAEVLEDE
jgi:hypothetical protein